MLGLWDEIHGHLSEPEPYGDDTTYRMGAAHLADCAVVEDWGCGKGWFRRFLGSDQVYRGIDGSATPFAEATHVDLAAYRSIVEGVFMRHVLEHNEGWEAILRNAVASFTRRMALVIFTPFAVVTQVLPASELGGAVPHIAFRPDDLTEHFGAARWTSEGIRTDSWYGAETVFYLSRD